MHIYDAPDIDGGLALAEPTRPLAMMVVSRSYVSCSLNSALADMT